MKLLQLIQSYLAKNFIFSHFVHFTFRLILKKPFTATCQMYALKYFGQTNKQFIDRGSILDAEKYKFW